MNNGWEIVKIEDLFEVKNGASIQSRDFTENKKDESFMEVLKIGHIAVGGGVRTEPKKDYVKKTPKLEKFILRKGDIVMAMTDMKDNVKILGVPAMVDKNNKYILNQRVGCLRKKETIDFDAKFVYYQMRTRRYLLPLQMQANRGVQVNLTTDHIKNSIVYLPPLAEQKRISSILSSLDSKIENNRKICANLEAQAQALFKHWFIDFAPFKDGKFVESELGRIPEGWRVGTFGEIVELIKPSIKPRENVVYSHYSIPSFDDNQNPSNDYGESIKSNKFAIHDSVTMLSKLNPDHKRIWYVDKVERNAVCSTEFLPFYAKDKEQSVFVYCYLNCTQNYREIANGAKGTTNSHQRIDANAILSRKIAYDSEAISQFSILVGDFMKQKEIAVHENSRLAELRDTLLPKLLSGEIKV